MFRFLTPKPGDAAHPLQTQKSAAAWFRQLPAADAIGRQLQVLRALDELATARKAAALDSIAAVAYLDTELGPDRGQLIAQYVDSAGTSGTVAERIWQAAYDISQGFIAIYRRLLEDAEANGKAARWKREVPWLLARLVHFYGTDAKLRALKSERWIPGKWAELHRLYVRALDLGIEREPIAFDRAGGAAPRRSIEQEYIVVLLTHLVNAGTLAASQVEWALVQLRAWCRDLKLETTPGAGCAFAVDLDGRRGLVRVQGEAGGSMRRYLDAGALSLQIERGLAALRRSGAADGQGASALSEQRIGILEKVRTLVAPETAQAVSREPRSIVRYDAEVRTGLARICQRLAPSDVRNPEFELSAPAGARTAVPQVDVPDDGSGLAIAQKPIPEARAGGRPVATAWGDDVAWSVQNRSNSGLRISAVGSIGNAVALGALVAIRPRDGGDWVLGVVRRMVKATSEKVDAGVAVIALRFSAVALHGKRHAREDMGFVVDGVDISQIGERFDGLYLPPPSRPKQPLALRSLVLPTSEATEGRAVVVITQRTVYTLVLREAIERHPDWTWIAVDIAARTARD